MIAILIGAVTYCQANGYCRSQPYPMPSIVEAQRERTQRQRQGKTRDEIQMEADILAFCSSHPDESFCIKLENYLHSHPWADPR
jgi:hypothetical protein